MATSAYTDPEEPALGGMLVAGGTIDAYEEGARQSRIADEPAPGMILHWSAQVSEGTVTGTVWRKRALGAQFISAVLADTFTDLSGGDRRTAQPRPDFSYEMLSLVAFSAGSSINLAFDRKIGDADGAVLIQPRTPGRGAGPARDVPLGMGAHVVATTDHGLRWLDVWLDPAASHGYYEGAGIDPASLETITLHTLIVNAEELAALPGFQRAN
jgi:hypothetical protein